MYFHHNIQKNIAADIINDCHISMCAVSNIEGKVEPIYKRLLVLIRFKNPNKTIPAIAPVNLLEILEGKAAIPAINIPVGMMLVHSETILSPNVPAYTTSLFVTTSVKNKFEIPPVNKELKI